MCMCTHGGPAGFGESWREGSLPWGFLACEPVSHGKEQGSCCLSYLNLGVFLPFPKLWECLHGHSCCGHSAQWPGFAVAEIGLCEPVICCLWNPQIPRFLEESLSCRVVSIGTGEPLPFPCFCDSESEGFQTGHKGNLSSARISRSQK